VATNRIRSGAVPVSAALIAAASPRDLLDLSTVAALPDEWSWGNRHAQNTRNHAVAGTALLIGAAVSAFAANQAWVSADATVLWVGTPGWA
jgi:hypothetical protein